MRKILILALLVFGLHNVYSQELFFKTGLNRTSYSFTDQLGEKLDGLSPGIGSSYEIGMGIPLIQGWLKYELGAAINSYNATGGDFNNNYTWNTTYGGINNSISFFPTYGELSIGILGILGVSTIISGTQSLNNSRFDLKKHPEFSGILIQPGLGLSFGYNIFNQGFLSIRYDISKSVQLGEESVEKLQYLNNRLLFGIHFNLD